MLKATFLFLLAVSSFAIDYRSLVRVTNVEIPGASFDATLDYSFSTNKAKFSILNATISGVPVTGSLDEYLDFTAGERAVVNRNTGVCLLSSCLFGPAGAVNMALNSLATDTNSGVSSRINGRLCSRYDRLSPLSQYDVSSIFVDVGGLPCRATLVNGMVIDFTSIAPVGSVTRPSVCPLLSSCLNDAFLHYTYTAPTVAVSIINPLVSNLCPAALSAQVAGYVVLGYTFAWTPTTSVTTPTNAGPFQDGTTYSVTATDAFGATGSSSIVYSCPTPVSKVYDATFQVAQTLVNFVFPLNVDCLTPSACCVSSSSMSPLSFEVCSIRSLLAINLAGTNCAFPEQSNCFLNIDNGAYDAGFPLSIFSIRQGMCSGSAPVYFDPLNPVTFSGSWTYRGNTLQPPDSSASEFCLIGPCSSGSCQVYCGTSFYSTYIEPLNSTSKVICGLKKKNQPGRSDNAFTALITLALNNGVIIQTE